jgi:enoyl-CoA hydratase/carnithine racemase
LPRVVARSRAKELIFTGRLVGAQEALSIGLLDYAVDSESALDEALRVARYVAQVRPPSPKPQP